jgi:hypothetical protein
MPRSQRVFFKLAQDDSGHPAVKEEALAALPTEDGNFILEETPLFAREATTGDVVQVEEKAGRLWYRSTLKPSGNSLIRVSVSSDVDVSSLRKALERLKCSTECDDRRERIAVNVPKRAKLLDVLHYLARERADGGLEYEVPLMRQVPDMAPSDSEVDQFMKALEHPLKAEIEVVRAAILASDPAISERIKWKAPSFVHSGDDRVTFRLAPKGIFQVILHRGAKVKDAKGFSFEDDSGLVEWLAPDRGVVTLPDAKTVKSKKAALVKLVGRWMAATAS